MNGSMERTKSGLGTNTVGPFDEVSIPLVWTIVEVVTIMWPEASMISLCGGGLGR